MMAGMSAPAPSCCSRERVLRHSGRSIKLNSQLAPRSGECLRRFSVSRVHRSCGRANHDQPSDEGIEPLVYYEYASEPDEDTNRELSHIYIDNSSLYQEKEISNFEVQNCAREKSLNITDNKKSGSKMKEISEEKTGLDPHGKNPLVMNPCTQIFELTQISALDSSLANNKRRDLKCPEYGSDEFADVEDNVRDSSSGSFCGVPTISPMVCMKNAFPRKKPKQDQELHTGVVLSDEASSSSSWDNALANEVGGGISGAEIIHGTEKAEVGSSNSRLPSSSSSRQEKGRRKNTCSMPTIAELAEYEEVEDFQKNQPSHSKPNPLKMKSKVGIRKDKCNVCRVRLGLCAIKCRCGGYYCAKHRYDKEHNCPFDYRSMGAEEIRRNNPRVVAEKVQKL